MQHDQIGRHSRRMHFDLKYNLKSNKQVLRMLENRV